MKAPRALSPFFKMALFLARLTPLSRGRARKIILNFARKHINHPVITDFHGVPFILNLDNATEKKALLGHYNLEELSFLKDRTSHPDAVFVDLGANSGFYTQNFLAGKHDNGRVLAIEPNPLLCQRIKDNYSLLQKMRPENNSKLIIECCAVGGEIGDVELDVSLGLGNAKIVPYKNSHTITVKMETLWNMLKKHGIKKIDMLKADIEGYEDRALVPFFTEADHSLFPENIIIEHTSNDCWEIDLLPILKDRKYIIVGKTRGNLLLSLSRRD